MEESKEACSARPSGTTLALAALSSTREAVPRTVRDGRDGETTMPSDDEVARAAPSGKRKDGAAVTVFSCIFS